MKPYSLSHFSIPDDWEHEGCIYVEPLDYWSGCFKIKTSYHTFIVNADDKYEAIDTLVDFLSINMFNVLKDIQTDNYTMAEIKHPAVMVTLINRRLDSLDGMPEDCDVKTSTVSLQNLQGLHELDFSYYDAKANTVASYKGVPTGNPPYVWNTGKFFLPDGTPITSPEFYNWLLEVVY